MMMLSQWGIKLGQILFTKQPPPAALGMNYFLPVMAGFAATYSIIVLLGILRSRSASVTRFDFLVPSMSAAFTYSIAYYVVLAWGTSTPALGLGGDCLLCRSPLRRLLARETEAGRCQFVHSCPCDPVDPRPCSGHRKFLLSLPALAVIRFFLMIFFPPVAK